MEKHIEMLRVEKLTKYYKCKNNGILSSMRGWISGKHDVGIENISFILSKNEVLGITGQGHCGKSTLLKIVSGIIKPTSGQTFYKGVLHNDEQLRKVTDYVSLSDIILDNRLSLMENIIQSFSNGDRGKIVDKAEEILNTFGIKEYEFKELRKLPIEAKKILTAIISLISTKPILCIDQPLLYLKDVHKKIYMSEIKQLASKGTSIIITSNSKDELSKVCNRIIEIK